MANYDVFISYASEDQDYADELNAALTSRGLNVWYDQMEIQIGDSIRRSIDNGLRDSNFGVVILSSRFLSKDWTQYELDGLMNKQMSGDRVILPIWHRLTADDIRRFPHSLADIVSLNSSTTALDQIADQIVERVGVVARRVASPVLKGTVQSFGVFFVAPANTPRPSISELESRPVHFYGISRPGWLSVTSSNEELEYRLDEEKMLRLRLSYGNSWSGDEFEASQMLSSDEPFALAIVDASGELTYYPSVRSRTPSISMFSQQSRSGWMVFNID